MKNVFKRFMNFLLVVFLTIGLVIFFEKFDTQYLINYALGLLVFLGFIGGLNYVFIGKFTFWNKTDTKDKS